VAAEPKRGRRRDITGYSIAEDNESIAAGTSDVGHLESTSPTAQPGHLYLHSWHATDANYYPADRLLFEQDLPHVVREYFTPGYAPAEPLLDIDDLVITLGSCFARELRAYLSDAGLVSTRFRIPEGLNNTFAILDFFSWCVTGSETGRGFRHDRLSTGEIREWQPESERDRYVGAFSQAGAFVLTCGLAEVWEDVETGGVFWRGIPQEIYDTNRHRSRLTTVEENRENLGQTIDLIRGVNEDAPVILTLSPVPLKATFRDVPCTSADCVSKSVLRVALDLLMAERRPNVYYWPSFEIVRWAGAHLDWPAYGFDDNKTLHVSRYLVGQIIQAFIEAFYVPQAVSVMQARRASGDLERLAPDSPEGRAAAVKERIERGGGKQSANPSARLVLGRGA
jgi:hypothetical protein